MADFSLVIGPRKSSLSREPEFGHRTYKATWVVMHSSTKLGPAAAILCPGLPQYGDTWAYGEEVDVWAWCRYETDVEQLFDEKTTGQHWACTFTFSTKPDDKGCIQQQIQNPFLQPPKISGNFTKFREEATVDRFGKPIQNSAFQQTRGPQVEFDDSRPVIKIEMNVAALNLPLLYSMRECVNQFPMWGFPPRCVKLSQISWDRQFYGTCFPYYNWKLEFETNTKTWDKVLMDEGTKALNGRWGLPRNGEDASKWYLLPVAGYTPPAGPPVGPNPDATIPSHFNLIPDPRTGNPMKCPLNGQGVPATGAISGQGCSAIAQLEPTDLQVFPVPVVQVFVLDGGSSYYSAPKVVFSPGVDGTAASTATGTATVANGRVTGVTVTSGGLYLSNGRAADGTFIDSKPPIITFVPTANGPGQYRVEKYQEADFSLLGIPLTF